MPASSFRQPTLPSPQELRNKTYHRGYAADDGTRVMYQRDWAKQHLLEGDGLLPLFYDHLSKIDRSHEQRLRGVSLPDTVVYEHNFPRAWYGWDRETQEIIKRPGRDLDARTIFSEFCERKDKKCDIIAQYCYVRGAEAAEEEVGGSRRRGASAIHSKTSSSSHHHHDNNHAHPQSAAELEHQEQLERERRRREKEMQRVYHPDTCVEFFTKETLYSFLTNPKPKPDGVLQRFVIPKGKASSRHNFQLQAIWSPVVTLVYKRTNRHLLGDNTISVSQRAPTFDGPPHLSTESLVAGSTLNRIDIVCRAIADHITFTEKKPIERLICYFKEDDEDRLWLMWASSLRVGGDQLNPVHVRVPMNLALRVETIRTILPKAEAIKASTELVGNDEDALLAKDVQLFDMTGDKDFARKCGGDLFPVAASSGGHEDDDEDDFGEEGGSFSRHGSQKSQHKEIRSARGTAASGGMTSRLQTPQQQQQNQNTNTNSEQNTNNSNIDADESYSNLENTTSTQQQQQQQQQQQFSSAEIESNQTQNNNNTQQSSFRSHHSPHSPTGRTSHRFNRFNPQNYPNGVLPPSVLLEKLEKEQQQIQQQQQQMMMQDDAKNYEDGNGNGGSGRRRRSPPRSARRSTFNNNNKSFDDTLSSNDFGSGSIRSGSARRSTMMNNKNSLSSAAGGKNSSSSNGNNHNNDVAPRIFISPRAPFLALTHTHHVPTVNDNSHPFHRAVANSARAHNQAEREKKLNREVGRSARKPPSGIVLLPGYKEAYAEENRRRLSFNSASRSIEDEEKLKGELLRSSLDIMYEAHSASLAAAKFIANDFQVPVPPLLTLCLDENELESLCRVMRVKSAQLINAGIPSNSSVSKKSTASELSKEGGGSDTATSTTSRRGSLQPGGSSGMKNANSASANAGGVKVVVTVPAGVSGRGSRLDRPLVQLHDDVKEFYDYLFATAGQTLWDRYCGGAM